MGFMQLYVLWGCHWQSQATLTSGEDMEQLFRNLSQFNLTTKNMSDEGFQSCLISPALYVSIFKLESCILQAEKSSLLVLQYYEYI